MPAVIGSGESTFVNERSAEPLPTVVVAVPFSLPGFGSAVAEETVAVFVRTVPETTVELTETVSVNTALPTARLGFEQETVPLAPTAGDVHDQPPGAENDTNVVPAGSVSDIETDAALLGPAFVAVIVYVKFVPAVTGSGVSTFVNERSADAATVVVAVPLSLPGFGSLVADEAVAVLEMTVPAAVDGSAATVSVNTALPTARLGFEQETVPPAPTAGVVHDQPPGDDSATNVVPAGKVSDKDTV